MQPFYNIKPTVKKGIHLGFLKINCHFYTKKYTFYDRYYNPQH
jgi:hypothetical protein